MSPTTYDPKLVQEFIQYMLRLPEEGTAHVFAEIMEAFLGRYPGVIVGVSGASRDAGFQLLQEIIGLRDNLPPADYLGVLSAAAMESLYHACLILETAPPEDLTPGQKTNLERFQQARDSIGAIEVGGETFLSIAREGSIRSAA